MAIGDLAGEALGGVLRFFGHILFEVVFEFLIKGTGYALIRLVRPRYEPRESLCGGVGLLFWVALAVGGFYLYRAYAA